MCVCVCVCRAVSPLNDRTAIKVNWGGDLIPAPCMLPQYQPNWYSEMNVTFCSATLARTI